MPFWTAENLKSKPVKWVTGEAYDIKGNDHVIHVQTKINESGEQDNFEIVLPRPNQLQLDYDVPELPEQFHKVLDIAAQAFCKLHGSLFYTVRKSRHNNLHITIDFPRDLTDIERIAWQSVFGSDPMREALSLMSVHRGIANPTLLIERRNTAPFAAGVKTLDIAAIGRKFRD
jgi:hypothetical protein